MSLFCKECFTLYREGTLFYKPDENNECPICGCNGELVVIDDFIAPTIKILNENGFKTEFCCSGHLADEYSYCFIIFSSSVTNKLISVMPTPPDGFEVHNAWGGRLEILYDFQKEGKDKYFEISEANAKLYQWALDLVKKTSKELQDNG